MGYNATWQLLHVFCYRDVWLRHLLKMIMNSINEWCSYVAHMCILEQHQALPWRGSSCALSLIPSRPHPNLFQVRFTWQRRWATCSKLHKTGRVLVSFRGRVIMKRLQPSLSSIVGPCFLGPQFLPNVDNTVPTPVLSRHQDSEGAHRHQAPCSGHHMTEEPEPAPTCTAGHVSEDCPCTDPCG